MRVGPYPAEVGILVVHTTPRRNKIQAGILQFPDCCTCSHRAGYDNADGDSPLGLTLRTWPLELGRGFFRLGWRPSGWRMLFSLGCGNVIGVILTGLLCPGKGYGSTNPSQPV